MSLDLELEEGEQGLVELKSLLDGVLDSYESESSNAQQAVSTVYLNSKHSLYFLNLPMKT